MSALTLFIALTFVAAPSFALEVFHNDRVDSCRYLVATHPEGESTVDAKLDACMSGMFLYNGLPRGEYREVDFFGPLDPTHTQRGCQVTFVNNRLRDGFCY